MYIRYENLISYIRLDHTINYGMQMHNVFVCEHCSKSHSHSRLLGRCDNNNIITGEGGGGYKFGNRLMQLILFSLLT